MYLNELLKILNEALPAETAMKGDRIGLQIQSGQNKIKKLLITLEITPEVIEEAQKHKTNCILTFHPLIFLPLTEIHDNERVGSLATRLIKNDTAVISIHTAFDAYIEGTSRIFSEKLALDTDSSVFLQPDEKYEGRGMGVLLKSEKGIEPDFLLERVSAVCGSPLRWCEGKKNKPLKKIAIVGGSGTSFMEQALAEEADAFITADITYHQFHRVNGKMMLIDPGHYEMEQFVPEGLAKLLREKTGSSLEIIINKKHTNPVRYYSSGRDYQKEQINILQKLK